MRDAHHSIGLQNDLYCVELDVKLYYTIPYRTISACVGCYRFLITERCGDVRKPVIVRIFVLADYRSFVLVF